MPTTENRAYPYPASTEVPDVPVDLQKLADAIDADVMELFSPRAMFRTHLENAQTGGLGTGSGGSTTSFRRREGIAPLINEGGFTVVQTGSAPMQVTVPGPGIYQATINIALSAPASYWAFVYLNPAGTFETLEDEIIETNSSAGPSSVAHRLLLRTSGTTLAFAPQLLVNINGGSMRNSPIFSIREIR